MRVVDTKLSVDRAAADVVHDERRHWSALLGQDVTNSAVLRLAFAFLRTFAPDPRAGEVVAKWRDQLGGQAADADQFGGRAASNGRRLDPWQVW